MSMLAEKKRREKWSLNPRGKAWSEDQNKFGLRLMEKMGWKAGQGLGANSQGQTDIVKARVKNDSKGLGFKENGEEWLKTTSDFDNLLDELASRENSGEGSQSDTPVSLEDRSKKSRARVHYHKFTRGKDLSRYSEKDLASIIGPDVIKSKDSQESKSNYTQNQVNKGSIRDYFNKKSKTKDKNTADNEIDGGISSGLLEPEIDSKSESRDLIENDECLDAVSAKTKKRKKRSDDENMAEFDNSTKYECCQVEDTEINQETDTTRKTKKRKKNSQKGQLNSEAPEENPPNSLDPSLSGEKAEEENKIIETEGHDSTQRSLDNLQSRNINPKKRKKSNENSCGDTENPVPDKKVEFQVENDEISHKKKRKKNIKDSDQSGNNENNTLPITAVVEPEINDPILGKKKKKKAVDSNTDQQMNNNLEDSEGVTGHYELVTKKKKNKSKEDHENYSLTQTDNDMKCGGNDDETVKRKKNKSKDRTLENQIGSLEPIDNNLRSENSNSAVTEEISVNEDVPVMKKRKVKERNKIQDEEPMDDEQKIAVKKHKKEKERQEPLVESETSHQTQVDSQNTSGDCLIVLGRRTRLRKLETVLKPTNNDPYETGDFLTFDNTENSKVETPGESSPLQSSDMNKNLLKSNLIQNKEKSGVAGKKVDMSPTIEIGSYIGRLRSSKLAPSKDIEGNVSNEKESCIRVYAEANTENCNMPKHVVAYEYRLVNARLKRLEIKVPTVKVIIKESKTLNESTRRKLRHIGKIQHLKTLLPSNDLVEIETLVKKFYDDLKPKIEMTAALSELEGKILEIAENMDGNIEQENADQVKIKSLWAEQAEEMTNLFQKIDTVLESYRKTEDEPSTWEQTTKENSDSDGDEDQSETKCEWLKKFEKKLDILKENMKILAEGKKPPNLNSIKESLTVTESNNITKNVSKRLLLKQYYQNKFSKGRISHNVGNVRGRGIGITRNQSGDKNAMSSDGWGNLKTYDSHPGVKASRGRLSYTSSRGRGSRGGRGFSERGRGVGGRRGFSEQGGEFDESGGRDFSEQDGEFNESGGRGFSEQDREFNESGGRGFSEQGREFDEETSFSVQGRSFSRGRGFSDRGRRLSRGRGFSEQGRRLGRGRGFSGQGGGFSEESGFSEQGRFSRGRGFLGQGGGFSEESGFSEQGRFSRGRGFSEQGEGYSRSGFSEQGGGFSRRGFSEQGRRLGRGRGFSEQGGGFSEESGFSEQGRFSRGRGFLEQGGGFSEESGFSEQGRFSRGRGFSEQREGYSRSGFSEQGGGFSRRGFSEQGRGFSRGRGFSEQERGFSRGRGFSEQGRGLGRGRGFSEQGGGFSRGMGFQEQEKGFSEGRSFSGRGRGLRSSRSRGRGREDNRIRGRISKTNYEAKLYAEKCKELNKVPEICFNGVNMHVISGYAANVSIEKISSKTNEESVKPAQGDQSSKEGIGVANSATKVSGDHLEVSLSKA